MKKRGGRRRRRTVGGWVGGGGKLSDAMKNALWRVFCACSLVEFCVRAIVREREKVDNSYIDKILILNKQLHSHYKKSCYG